MKDKGNLKDNLKDSLRGGLGDGLKDELRGGLKGQHEMLVLGGLFTASLNEKGEWIYKANNQGVIKSKTKKAEYKEKPRYKLNTIIESKMKGLWEKLLSQGLDEIGYYLKAL